MIAKRSVVVSNVLQMLLAAQGYVEKDYHRFTKGNQSRSSRLQKQLTYLEKSIRWR
jgi:hypothetical protein